MNVKKAAGVAALALAGYDALVGPRMLGWGASRGEQHMQLPGDEIASGVPAHHTRAVTIEAPPEAVWPWLAQIGDHRAGFYSYEWVERFIFPGTVHYIEGTHSATRIHPELQEVHVGDRINTGSIGKKFAVGNPVTVIEPGRALVIGTWAFVLQPLPGRRTVDSAPPPRPLHHPLATCRPTGPEYSCRPRTTRSRKPAYASTRCRRRARELPARDRPTPRRSRPTGSARIIRSLAGFGCAPGPKLSLRNG